jgi:hypothetical protein
MITTRQGNGGSPAATEIVVDGRGVMHRVAGNGAFVGLGGAEHQVPLPVHNLS